MSTVICCGSKETNLSPHFGTTVADLSFNMGSNSSNLYLDKWKGKRSDRSGFASYILITVKY